MTLFVLAQVRRMYDVEPSIFTTAGPDARRAASLGWGMTIAAAIIFVGVVAILLWGLWRRRHAPPVDGPPPPVNADGWVLGGGMLMPGIVLAAVFFFTVGALGATGHAAPNAPEIEVIGHQWWWEVRYPHRGVKTANEIHIPVGVPVRVRLRSQDVIHSFWIPNINGKTDVFPGSENTTWLEADEPGVYRGECAEFCGMQHAHMELSVVAESRGAYDHWLQGQSVQAHQPVDSIQTAGYQAFMKHGCNYCHTIAGTQAGGDVGPNLTHIGSRLTLAAGTLANTPANLGGWIENPDALKPGVKMPPVPMAGGELNALVQYLYSLK